jgi:hypothetical protein
VVLDLVRCESKASPPLGAEDDRNGETLGLRDLFFAVASKGDSKELPVSAVLGLPVR